MTRPPESGMRARARSSRCSPAMAIASIPPPIRPTAPASSPRRTTRPPASGMRAPGRSSRCSPAMAMSSIPPPTRPTAPASSPRRGDKTARIWDARTGAQLAVLSGHGDVVDSAAYSPDGTRIVTASDDKTARIWDARTGRSSRCSPAMAISSNSAAYSPDGTRIVTASDDKTARIWDARVPATLDGQIAWDAAAETDPLSDVDRTRLGLPPDPESEHGRAKDPRAIKRPPHSMIRTAWHRALRNPTSMRMSPTPRVPRKPPSPGTPRDWTISGGAPCGRSTT